ncbi:uncharacterized protein UTRI_02473 [Ustilago trichophora]|uniref:Uncharacterized protein n=1 Tax=Ustilago trichophora TaxID=86804 RepID=A0A5C3E970_9BASI|nr:uncharacterized protein UTRI_02473 [Ustilago trichophora]
MPAVRTTPKDVLIRVPKVEPYSNRYLPPSVRAKEEANKAAGEAAASTADSTLNTAAAVGASIDSTATTSAAPAAPAAVATSTEDASNRERGNSPILPFLSLDRQEDQTVELSKAATSSAGWNSLLVWARRQRGAQWDESTALWQVDKYSREYYSFCQDPATTDRSKQPGDDTNDGASKKENDATGADKDKVTLVDEDEDKGPTRISSRNSREDAGGAASPPPIATGRSARLLRR